MKARKKWKIFFVIVLVVFILAGATAGIFFIMYSPSLTVDFSVKTGTVTSGASGYLYGMAESGVPSDEMIESVDVSTVSQKVPDGLQHPIGDIDHVADSLNNTDYNVVYLQDDYDTWYYANDEILQMRADGTYDWESWITEDYFPRIKEAVSNLMNASYSEKVVYCLYNECDNGVWFGTTKETADNDFGVYGDYDEAGKQNFYKAWKLTYDYVKSIHPNALIGGPGFYEYHSEKIEGFIAFCVQNDCLPDIMIYHELADGSIYYWQDHVSEYREIENKYAVQELDIIVTEYGRMQDNGLPGKMLQYITQIETSKVYGDNAYWRLANNLCDVAADDNSPNSNWWLYRWYADMEGQTVSSSYQDLFKSNFAKAIKNRSELKSQGFMGIASITDEEDKIELICGGRSGSASVKLENLDATLFDGKTVDILIEETVFKGISGVVSAPVTVKEYTAAVKNGKLLIQMTDMEESDAYHIVLTVHEDGDNLSYENSYLSQRYEFEQGTLLGNAYTYDSAYATTGEENGMVGGMENDGDGVEISFQVPEDGLYQLDIIFGNSNDSDTPDGRADSTTRMTLDGKETVLSLPNTIKSEYTDCCTLQYEVSKGKHTLIFSHDTGTIVLDSLLVTKCSEKENTAIAVLDDADRTTDSVKSFLAVAPSDGYYDLSLSEAALYQFEIDSAEAETDEQGNACVYLRRGLNYIDVETEYSSLQMELILSSDEKDMITLEPEDAVLEGTATLETNTDGISYLNSITCTGGSARFTVSVPADGTYKMTVLYANNDEGGVHDYNVDLIERYITVGVGESSEELFCRNTYSWETFKTVTANIELKAGDNIITLSNSGTVKFNNQDTSAPYISTITINPAAK